MVVICGSAASYMVHKIISNKGSLHARLSYKLQLKPFTLHETELYLKSKNIHWSHYHILHLYIAIGGIPHYLSKVKRGESVVQNIQRMCFDVNGDLVNEFDEIFESLFTHSQTHSKLIRTLGKINKGITREELIQKTGFSGGGHFSKALDELFVSGFVSAYTPFNKQKKSTLYRLSDEYARFYLKYIEKNKNQGKNFWKTLSNQQSYISWAGFNFETICLKHTDQIKKALGIEGIHSVQSNWSSKDAQVDLVIARSDKWINLFEMKFYQSEYAIDKAKASALRQKVEHFKRQTKTRHTVTLSMLTTYGIAKNEHFYDMIDHDLNIDILFRK